MNINAKRVTLYILMALLLALAIGGPAFAQTDDSEPADPPDTTETTEEEATEEEEAPADTEAPEAEEPAEAESAEVEALLPEAVLVRPSWFGDLSKAEFDEIRTSADVTHTITVSTEMPLYISERVELVDEGTGAPIPLVVDFMSGNLVVEETNGVPFAMVITFDTWYSNLTVDRLVADDIWKAARFWDSETESTVSLLDLMCGIVGVTETTVASWDSNYAAYMAMQLGGVEAEGIVPLQVLAQNACSTVLTITPGDAIILEVYDNPLFGVNVGADIGFTTELPIGATNFLTGEPLAAATLNPPGFEARPGLENSMEVPNPYAATVWELEYMAMQGQVEAELEVSAVEALTPLQRTVHTMDFDAAQQMWIDVGAVDFLEQQTPQPEPAG